MTLNIKVRSCTWLCQNWSSSNLFPLLNRKLNVLCIVLINTWKFCMCLLLKISKYIKSVIDKLCVLKKTSFVIFNFKNHRKRLLRVVLLKHTWSQGFHCLIISTVDECLKHFYWMKMQQVVGRPILDAIPG